MLTNIEKAIKIAYESHAEQKDKNNKPYILHPIAVAMNFRYNENKFIVSILHDVIEDTNVTIADLIEAGFSKEITDSIELLTRRENETYKEFIERIELSNNEIAISVKVADIIDNINRLDSLSDKEMADYLMLRYSEALEYLKFCHPVIVKEILK